MARRSLPCGSPIRFQPTAASKNIWLNWGGIGLLVLLNPVRRAAFLIGDREICVQGRAIPLSEVNGIQIAQGPDHASGNNRRTLQLSLSGRGKPLKGRVAEDQVGELGLIASRCAAALSREA
jgi:hypothetical protein